MCEDFCSDAEDLGEGLRREDLDRGTVGIHPALMHQEHVVCIPRSEIQVVKHGNDGGSGAGEGKGEGEKLVLVGEVEAGDRFIKKDGSSFRPIVKLGQCARPVDPLLFPTGEAGHDPIREVGDSGKRHGIVGACACFSSAMPRSFRSEEDHFAGKEREAAFALLCQKNPFPGQFLLGKCPDISLSKEHPSFAGGELSRENAQQGALAGPIWSGDDQEGSGGNGEVQFPCDDPVFPCDGEIFRGEKCHWPCPFPRRMRKTKNGAPREATTMPAGISAGARAILAKVSAAQRRLPPARKEAGRTSR